MGYRARVRGEINRRLRRGRPLLSAVVTTCDSAEHLDDCLRSLRDQDVRDLEILVVDLGSADTSLEIARRHVAWHGLAADSRMTNLRFRILRIDPEHVQRNLTVNGNRLNPTHDAGAGASEHAGLRR